MSLNVTIRFRAEKELRDALAEMARSRHKKMSDLLRELSWEIVEARKKKRKGAVITPLDSTEADLAGILARNQERLEAEKLRDAASRGKAKEPNGV